MSNNIKDQTEFKSLKGLTQHINSIPTAEIAAKLGLKLHKTGNSLQGDCPSGHVSKHGNCFNINTEKDYWHCFNCEKGGDNISLVQLALNLNFKEALEWISKEFSIKYTLENKEITPEEIEKEQIFRMRTILYETAYKWMHSLLFEDEGKEVHYYLTEDRGYDPDKLKDTEFCVFPEIKKIRQYLLEQHSELESYIKDIPLYGAYGELFDLALPYRNRHGKITGFVKRSIEPDGVTITTKDGKVKEHQRYDSTAGLSKNDLFNLHKCFKQDTLVIVEGYPDAIYFSALGMKNIVAAGQGKLSKAHIDGLRHKNIKYVILSFDKDDVGPGNSEKAVKMLLENSDITPYVLDPELLTPHKDPDEYVKANGLEAYQKLLKKSKKGIVWCAERLISNIDEEDALAKEKVRQEILNLTTLTQDPSDVSSITDLIVKHFQIGKQDVKQLVNGRKKEQRIEDYKKTRKDLGREKRYVPFIERSTCSYSYWDKKENTVYLGAAKEVLENILASAGQKLPDTLLVLKADFDAHFNERIDADREIFNLFVPSKYMLLTKTDKFIDPRKQFAHIYKLLTNLIPNYRERKRFINWLAGILQTREKQLTAWVFKGMQGAGKGLLLNNILKPLFGDRQSVQIEDQQLTSEFNPWLQNAILIAFNEVAHDNNTRNSIKSKLKAIITDSEIMINEKQVRNFFITNYVNCIFFSNEAVPVFIESGDRRFNVIRTGDKLDKNTWFNVNRDQFLDFLKNEVPQFAQFLMNYRYNSLEAKTCINNSEKEVLVTASMNRFEEFAMHLKDGNVEWFENNCSSGTMMPSIKIVKSDISGGVLKELALKVFNAIHYPQEVSDVQLGRQLKLYGITPERVMDNGVRKNYYLW